MRVRTVRLDEESERALQEVVGATGLSTSAALKQGVMALRRQLSGPVSNAPADVYGRLDLGSGGYAQAASTDTRRGVQDAVRKKIGR